MVVKGWWRLDTSTQGEYTKSKPALQKDKDFKMVRSDKRKSCLSDH
jgi:hypothetical protein